MLDIIMLIIRNESYNKATTHCRGEANVQFNVGSK